MNINVIDLETTGLNPAYAEIVEIACVRIRNDKIVSRFQTLVWPGEDCFKPPGVSDAMAIQGRKMEDFREGIHPFRAVVDLSAFLNHADITAYNISFEKPFITKLMNKQMSRGIPEESFYVPDVLHYPFCIMIRSAEIMGEAGSPYCPWSEYHQNYKWPKLAEAAEFFKVPHENGHNALTDAGTSAQILLKMIERGVDFD